MKDVKKGLLGAAIALLVCGGVYVGITAYVRNTGEAKVSTGWKKEYDKTQTEERDPIASVVTDSEEVTYDRFEIEKETSTIKVKKAGDEAVSNVANPNKPSAKVITLLTKGVGFAKIVYPAGNESAKVAAQNLSSQLARKTGYQLPVTADSTKEATYEVLVGMTNRTASTTAGNYMAQKDGAYAVQTTGEKVVLVGKNTTALNKAVAYVVSKANTVKGEVTIAKNINYAWNSSNKYHKAIMSANSLNAQTERLAYDIKDSTGWGIPQGGCSDGTYFYQMVLTKQMSDENKNECEIVKVDLKSGNLIKRSGVLSLNHANDVTYNSKLNCLIVCHNAPNRDTLSYVDVNTLTIIKTFTIDYEIYCIDYNAAKDQYVVGLSGGQSFRILDSDFKAVGKVHMPTDDTTQYTTQGVGSDDEFIYFALHNSKDNFVITVYDWNGNFVSKVMVTVQDLSTSTESIRHEIESISFVNGTMYLNCAERSYIRTSGNLKWIQSCVYKVTGLTAK